MKKRPEVEAEVVEPVEVKPKTEPIKTKARVVEINEPKTWLYPEETPKPPPVLNHLLKIVRRG
jgi:hypothetical protein